MLASSVPSLPLDFLKTTLHALAEQNVYLGTSSWKYLGWLGML